MDDDLEQHYRSIQPGNLLPQKSSTFPPPMHRSGATLPPPLPARHSLPPVAYSSVPPPLPKKHYTVNPAYAVYLSDGGLLGVYGIQSDAAYHASLYGGTVVYANVLMTDDHKFFLLAQAAPIKMEEYLTDDNIRAIALAKLTQAEKDVLGLND